MGLSGSTSRIDAGTGRPLRRRRATVIVAAIVVIALVICIVFSISLCTLRVREAHEQELTNNLQVATEQSAKMVETKLNDELNLMNGLSVEVADGLKAGWSAQQISALLDTVDETFQFKRIGYIDADANVCTSDDIFGKIFITDDIAKTFAGKCVITKPFSDSYDGSGELINVIRVPVYEFGNEGGPVIGVLFATVSHSVFNNMLDFEGFEGAGFACVLDEEGNVIDVSDDGNIYGDDASIMEYMELKGGVNEDAVHSLMADLASGTSNMSYFEASSSSSVQGAYMYHASLDLDNHASKWQFAIVVPSSYLSGQVEDLMSVVYRMLSSVLVLLLFIAIVSIVVVSRIRKADHERIKTLAYTDPLTGAANFNKFKEEIATESSSGVIVSFDIDSFKDINSVCGVERGNTILRLIWDTLKSIVDDGDLAARVNGDHFVLFLKNPYKLETDGSISVNSSRDANAAKSSSNAEDFKDSDDAIAALLSDGNSYEGDLPDAIKQGIRKRLLPISLAMVKISCDLETPLLYPRYGVYPWTGEMDIEECYSRAVSAASHVTNETEGRVSFFSVEDFSKINEDAAIIQAFSSALAAGEFEPFYQPKFSPGGRLEGAEALARWRKPDGTLVPPYKFIPLYEHNGMIRQLDQDIFRQVCLQQAKWIEEGRKIVPVSVNLSRASLRFQGVHDDYVRIVHEVGVAPDLVPIEVTESAIADDKNVAEAIRAFRTSGFPIHMDDFGSGYSSLAALGSMNFDALKIDKSLVDCIGGKSGEKLLKHSVQLAQEMQLVVTAEGVEREDQVEFLKDLGCNNIQGFYFSRPLDVEAFNELLA